jgi:hypothetical protein
MIRRIKAHTLSLKVAAMTVLVFVLPVADAIASARRGG